MPFIEKREPLQKKKHVSVQMPLQVADELKEYVSFIGKQQGQVVSEILEEVFRRDKDFAEFKRSKGSKVATMPEPQSAAG
jgi:hypothetical protein